MTLTNEQWAELLRAFPHWMRIRLDYEPRFRQLLESGDADRIVTQLAADVWHSALLHRMLVEGKQPLPEPPRVEFSYPVYPDEDDDEEEEEGR